MNLYKRYSTAVILFGIFSSKPLIEKGSNLLKMSNYYCLCRAVQGQLSQCNRRKNVLRAMLKSHKGLKGTKVFAFWVFCKKSKKFLKIYRKEPLLGSFYCKAVAWNNL